MSIGPSSCSDGKGAKDRVVTLPDELIEPLKRHLENRKTLFERDLATGHRHGVLCPMRLPESTPTRHANGLGNMCSSPASAARIRAPVRSADITWTKPTCSGPYVLRLRKAGIVKPASCHTLTPLFCDPSAGTRCRHPDRAGAAWSFGRAHDADLHARAQARRARGEESARSCAGDLSARLCSFLVRLPLPASRTWRRPSRAGVQRARPPPGSRWRGMIAGTDRLA